MEGLVVGADFAQFTTFHQVTFNMFQRNVFGFRHQPQGQQDKQHVQASVDPEGVGVTQIVQRLG